MKKRPASSVLAARIRQRKAVAAGKSTVRHVAFSPAETAYDLPYEASHFVPVGRGPKVIFKKPMLKATVDLDEDVAEVFNTSRQVNNALRKLIEAMPKQPKAAAKRRKSV